MPTPSTPRDPDRIHVLFLIDILPAQGGGAERAVLRIAGSLPSERFRCSIAAMQTPDLERLRPLLPCPLHIVPVKRIFSPGGVLQAFRLWRLIRRERVDLLSTFFTGSDFLGLLAAKAAGCRIVSNRRDLGIFRDPRHDWFYRHMSWFDRIHAVSEQVRAHLIRTDRVPPERVQVVYNGVDLRRFDGTWDQADIRRSLGLQDASHVIVAVGNMRPVKGYDVMLESAAQVRREFPKVRFVIVGHEMGDTHRQLLKQAASLQLEDTVLWTGPAKDVTPYLRAADIFCLLSRSEGFSNAILEAMACALPLVVTNVGGNPEAVADGETGFLVKLDDPAEAAGRLLTLMRDGALAKRMGAAGRRTVEQRFSLEVITQRLVELYTTVVRAPGGSL